MSYKAYLNNIELDLKGSVIALTKQTNDLAKLTNRQSNFTNRFTIPLTSGNIAAVKNVFLLGNQSTIPYQLNSFDLIDSDSGLHLIYKGMAVLNKTTKQGYEISVFDGIIEFYKTIENKTLTDLGLKELNHIKNIKTIENSWTQSLPYKYIIADYNGKLFTNQNYLNADYLVPSALRSFIFNKIHEFAGYTFEGLIFMDELYTNDWITFPKPVPTTEPLSDIIYNGLSTVDILSTWYTGAGGVAYTYYLNYFPTFENNINFTVGQIRNRLTINKEGAYKIKLSLNTIINNSFSIQDETITHYNQYGIVKDIKVYPAPLGSTNTFICEVNDYLIFGSMTIKQNLYYQINIFIVLLQGFSVNFDTVLIDLKVTDFLNETMVKFGLTAYKDKYRNHLVYKKIKEVVVNSTILDWSDKFDEVQSESYTIGDYAQQNDFKYRYNNSLEQFNNGFFPIDNKNLKENKTVYNSIFFSPENDKTFLLGQYVNVYKMWDKNIQDNNTVEYKDLNSRYYAIRFENKVFSSQQTIGSDLLGGSFTFTNAPIESFARLRMKQIIYDNYFELGAIFDKAKFMIASMYLSAIDYQNFDFQKLVYIKQKGSNFIVNKISNFIPYKKCSVELIECDLFTNLSVQNQIDYYIRYKTGQIFIDNCMLNLRNDVESNLPANTPVKIIPYIAIFNPLAEYVPSNIIIDGVLNGLLLLQVSISQLPPAIYKFRIYYNENTFTELSQSITINGACYAPISPTPNITYITITKVETISIGTANGLLNQRQIKITYVSDLNLQDVSMKATSNGQYLLNKTDTNLYATQNGSFTIFNDHLDFNGFPNVYSIDLTALQVTSNTVQS